MIERQAWPAATSHRVPAVQERAWILHARRTIPTIPSRDRMVRSAHRSRAAAVRTAATLLLVFLAGACHGPQSALSTAGRDAEVIARLWWWMAAGAVLIWGAVVGLAWFAIRVGPERHSKRAADLLIVGGGAIAPTLLLGGLLAHGLSMMPPLLELPDEGGVRIEVSGEQWWWRVTYHLPNGSSFELANELYLPVGRRTELALVTPDVIHSFWVPSLAGKMDMIPGRVNRLALEPTRTGVFRGACAEYCGASHALMSLYAVVVEEARFEEWLSQQAAPARAATDPVAARGARFFREDGCGACHAIRGTSADGVIGPDLTHVAGRTSLAAGALPNDEASLIHWITRPEATKPGAHMPSFGMLGDARVRAIAAYLAGLE